MPHLSLSLLGGFKITLGGSPVTAFGTDKARALLAYLAIESDRPHRRALLAGMFWPELSQERAAHNLSQSLLRLRRALHDDKVPAGSQSAFLHLTSQEVRFNLLSDSHLDVLDFLELTRAHRQHQHADASHCAICINWLRQAAELYHGDLLAGLTLRDSMPFEEWQVLQRESLHRQAVETLSRLTDYYDERGESDHVLVYAGRLVTLEPWQERAQIQLMMALAKCGQEAAALEQYIQYSYILAQEFGAAPARETTELYEQIRSRQLSNRSGLRVTTGELTPLDERRQVTALLCQWQGSPGDDDPEDLQDGLLHFERTLNQISERYGGRPQPRHGSEFLIYFGYPVAHDDTVRNAVSAALALAGLSRDHPHIRIGVHTGMMVSHNHELLGNAPDLARDCLRLGEPGSVMITASTERLVHNWFICQTINVGDPIARPPAYRVQAGSAAPDRPVWITRARQTTPLIGREAEIKQLTGCLKRVRRGHGQIITVCGEPGIGKTRLTREFKHLCPWPAVWLESRCSPYFQNTSLYPFIDLLEQLLGFSTGDDAAAKREKLAAALARCQLTAPDTLWLLSILLELPTDTPAPRIITEDQRERMREVYLTLLQREAARQPVMLLIEDLHWADPTTVAWINRSLDALAAAPCLLWLNWRPEFVAPWLPRPHVLALNLEPLNAQQAATLINEVISQSTLTDEVREQIIRQADGIPLFLEELANSVREVAVFSRTPEIPATLRDPLTARLDRAGTARATAQWASILGRELTYAVLRAVVPYEEERLQHDLAMLTQSDLLVARDQANTRYAFKHALIQEAAYRSLLKRARQEYHGRVADTLLTHFPDIATAQPEVVAQHYSLAGLAAQAIDYWLRAGEHAAAQGATLEARTFLDRALAEVDPADLERRWRVLLNREAILDLREERPEQQADIEALLKLAEDLNDDTRRVQALLRQADYANRMENFQLMLHACTAAAAIATRQRNAVLTALVLSTEVVAYARLERWSAVRPIVDQVFELLPQVKDDTTKTLILGNVAMYFSDLGDVAQSLQIHLWGAEIARRQGERGVESRHLANIGLSYARLGLYAEAQAALESGLALATATGDRVWQNILSFDLCYVLWCRGDRAGARNAGERALQAFRTGGYRFLALATCMIYLGLLLEDEADYGTAAAYLAESRRLFNEGGLHGPGMEAQAAEARCVLALGQYAEAQRLAYEVWDFIGTHGTVTMDFPARVYLCIAAVVAQVPTPGITERVVLEAGYRELQQQAERINNLTWRRSFLDSELSNRALVMRWKQLQQKPIEA